MLHLRNLRRRPGTCSCLPGQISQFREASTTTITGPILKFAESTYRYDSECTIHPRSVVLTPVVSSSADEDHIQATVFEIVSDIYPLNHTRVRIGDERTTLLASCNQHQRAIDLNCQRVVVMVGRHLWQSTGLGCRPPSWL